MPVAEAGPVREAMAEALAEVEQPDLSAFTPEQVAQAMDTMFGPDGIKPEWLDWLRMEINRRSGDRTTLVDADRDEFAWLSKEWGAVYQRLSSPNGDQLVIIGNSMPPFLFVPHK